MHKKQAFASRKTASAAPQDSVLDGDNIAGLLKEQRDGLEEL